MAPPRTRSRRKVNPLVKLAVVADREAAGIELGEQRLHVAQNGLAGRGVADVADGSIAGEALDHLAAGEGVPDEAEPPLGMKPGSVEGDDTRRPPGRDAAGHATRAR